jgi:magnesium chelatase family protein
MLARLWSAALAGIDALPLEVEVDVSHGIPTFQIVGLADTAVKESRERVRAALRNVGRDLPPRSIVVNLAPADLRKEGSGLDLPVAVGLLAALGDLPVEALRGRLFAGEVALDGTLRTIPGALSMAVLAASEHFAELVVPSGNADEAAAAPGSTVIGARTLDEIVAHLAGRCRIEPRSPAPLSPAPGESDDLDEVRGQARAKRALEIAAAGGHNVLFVGPPGSGKTMLARRLPSILPPLTPDEIIETTRIHSVSGLTVSGSPLVSTRPFRAPHHSISGAGLVGGGARIRAGEVSLAHNGVLFLDELPEFRRDTLELLRQPLEEGRVTIVRASGRITFPARFCLVAALNPCPCGFLGHPTRACRCTPREVTRYASRISGPLLDRFDLRLEVPSLGFETLSADVEEEPSRCVRERVVAARRVQEGRFALSGARTNSDLSGRALREWAAPDRAGRGLLETATTRFGLSARGFTRLLRVARTIADLAGEIRIGAPHVAEAIQYRALERIEAPAR